MKLTLSSVVQAPRERVFAALVDPAILQKCIPGCESLAEIAPDTYEATLKIGVAGLKGTYKGKASISDKRPPEALTLGFEGKGSPGFVRGSAAIAASDHVIEDCICQIHVFVKYIQVAFPRGVDLHDAAGALQGSGKAFRYLKLTRRADVTRSEIREFVRQARANEVRVISR